MDKPIGIAKENGSVGELVKLDVQPSRLDLVQSAVNKHQQALELMHKEIITLKRQNAIILILFIVMLAVYTINTSG